MSAAEHRTLIRLILLEIGAMPGVIIGGNPTGHAVYVDPSSGNQRHVPYGWPSADGGPDILAVVAPFGRMLAIECKTGTGRATREQLAVHAALRACGVHVIVARCVNDAKEALAKMMLP